VSCSAFISLAIGVGAAMTAATKMIAKIVAFIVILFFRENIDRYAEAHGVM
jgi:hypothetical protein